MNPEFRRILITEFQGYRLIALPLVLGAIFGVPYYTNDFSFGDDSSFFAVAGFFGLVFVWGTRQAAESVLQEINRKTWDPQRMSSMSAWGMCWAKLAGSTAFSWLGGLLCLAIFAASNWQDWAIERTTISVVLFIGSGILAQIVCFLISLLAVQRRRDFGRVQVVAYQFLGLLSAFPPLYIAMSVSGGAGILELVTWFDEYLSLGDFMILFTGVFVAWGLIGIWALMRVELQTPTGPWLWALFVSFTLAFFAGVRALPVGPDTPIALYDYPSIPTVVLIVGVLMVYLIAMAEGKDRLRLRRLDTAVRERHWHAVLALMPRSLITILVVVAGLFVAAIGFSDHTPARGHELHLMYTGMIAFLCRDLALIYLVCLGRRDGRGEAIAMIGLVLLYTLIPEVLGYESKSLLFPLFSVLGEKPTWWTVAAPALEFGAVAWVLVQRWQRAIASPKETGGAASL